MQVSIDERAFFIDERIIRLFLSDIPTLTGLLTALL
jgi:hypothetical protein